ncbi:MAG: type II toxin-antitoxin system RelE/ParE family toxin [Victivallaceae bacterium]|nr:type II toxin-antitoxin system RelE/ParE family toxin [Victivallaceae bacterium]
MILNFKCQETQKIFKLEFSRKLPEDIQKTALRKLKYLNSAVSLEDLKVPPNNRLEALTGNRTGQYSIRINRQFRICFRWQNGNAVDVEIIDYH